LAHNLYTRKLNCSLRIYTNFMHTTIQCTCQSNDLWSLIVCPLNLAKNSSKLNYAVDLRSCTYDMSTMMLTCKLLIHSIVQFHSSYNQQNYWMSYTLQIITQQTPPPLECQHPWAQKQKENTCKLCFSILMQFIRKIWTQWTLVTNCWIVCVWTTFEQEF